MYLLLPMFSLYFGSHAVETAVKGSDILKDSLTENSLILRHFLFLFFFPLFFSYTIHPNCSHQYLPSSMPPHLPFPQDELLLCFPSQRNRRPSDTRHDKMQQDKEKREKSLIKTNPVGVKGSQGPGKSQRNPNCHYRSPTKTPS